MGDQTPEERFIRALEYARRPHGSVMDFNQDTLANALNILASEMNVTPCHYQLELVQNADDNKYAPGVEPSLTLAFQDALPPQTNGYLWVGCNEQGMDEASVRAICDIGGSTKKVNGSQKGYIGEKGIGFKSIFKVADKVWIRSGNYQFSLSREGLGMISPVWEDFKSTAMVDEQTMFCLRIPKKEDQIHVKTEMLSLKPELLLFLRKLRNINVIVDDRKEKVMYRFSVHREDNLEHIENGYTTTQLSRIDESPIQDTKSEQMVVFRHTTQSMPLETKRPGIKETEIVLAFPTVFDNSSRMTFNFLPIRDFGFPFLLQADFITNVNREDINHHNKWNDALLEAATNKIVQCIKTFNKAETEQMRAFKYSWMYFITSRHTAPDTIMAKFFPHLLKRLNKEPVLESQARQFATPSSLTILAERWTDHGSPLLPLFGEATHLMQYVSDGYRPEDLCVLDVKSQSPSYFAGLLRKMRPEQLQQKSEAWHCRLAEAMLEKPPVSPKSLVDIKIIPLRDGTWVTTAKNDDLKIYFPDMYNRVDVPSGIEMRIVEPKAAEHPARKILFGKLDVVDLDQKQVCHLILERHKELHSPTKHLPNLSVDTLVDHAKYLYKFRETLNVKRVKTLKFAVRDSDKAVFGNELYMDSIVANTFLMGQHFAPSEDFHFIHPAYINDIHDVTKQPWHDWLRSAHGISTTPKLVIQQGVVSPLAAKHDLAHVDLTMHPLFKHLVDLPNSMIWLTLLRDNWHFYWLDIQRLQIVLQQTLVTCTNNTRKPLCKVYLPTTDVLKEPLALTGVDLLDTGDRDGSWRELDFLGLRRKVDLDFYCDILRKAADGEVEAQFSDIKRIMQGIQHHTIPSNESRVKNFFGHKKLIAVPCNESLSWLKTKECMWRAPECLPGITALEHHYVAGSETFFNQVLDIYDATADRIAEELDLNADQVDKIPLIKALLKAFSLLVSSPDRQLEFPLDLLRATLIFPVWQLNGKRDLVAANDETWFIADDHRHQKSFQGKVALLDFSIDEITQLLPLFSLLGNSRRVLSCSIFEDMDIQGTSTILTDESAELQSKAGYIALLVPIQNKTTVESHLRTIEVFASKKMQLKRYVQIGGRKVYGTNEVGKAGMRERETPMQLHCRHGAFKNKQASWYNIVESIAKAFNIPRGHRETLTLILVTQTAHNIEDMLSSKGLWDKAVADLDDADEEDEQDDEPESDCAEQGNKAEATLIDDDDQSDDCLFVSSNHRRGSSSEHSNTEAPTSDDATSDAPENLQAPSPGKPKVQSSRRRAPPSWKTSGPSDGEKRAAKKAQRETAALAAIGRAAADYILEDVNVYEPTASTGKSIEHLAGLAFGKTRLLHELSDQNDRIRYLGELFVRGILNSHFNSSDDAWTSPMRTRQKLGKLEIAELDESSTFTVSDGKVILKISKSFGLKAAGSYHIFVKATAGDFDEPFSVSNHELELAKRWASNADDITLIFRVYNLEVIQHKNSDKAPDTDPKFAVLVDPIKQMQGGNASMTALDGFSMNMTQDHQDDEDDEELDPDL